MNEEGEREERNDDKLFSYTNQIGNHLKTCTYDDDRFISKKKKNIYKHP